MALYKAKWTDRKGTHEGKTHKELGAALWEASQHLRGSKVVTIVRDSEGADHPDNAGKYFLHQILK